MVIFSLSLQIQGKHGNNCDYFCDFKNMKLFDEFLWKRCKALGFADLIAMRTAE